MNNIIFLLLLISTLMPLGIDVAKVVAAQKQPQMVTASFKPVDMRAVALQRVMEKHDSPLAPHADFYIKTADKYGVDWRLLPAIAGLESSFGKRQMPGSYNSYGWGGGHIYFESYEDGIETIIASLKKRYYDRGADTVYKIAPIYAESPTWAPRVSNFMDQIEKEYSLVKATTLPLTI